MAKSDFHCAKCKKVKGTGFFGGATEQYKCAKCGKLCRDCVKVKIPFLGSHKISCLKCGGDALTYKFSDKNSRWEKA